MGIADTARAGRAIILVGGAIRGSGPIDAPNCAETLRCRSQAISNPKRIRKTE